MLPFAPDAAYGTPDDLKALIDAAHDLGLMMFLDVVYNHFGPDGNYLRALRAAILSRRRHDAVGAGDRFPPPAKCARFFTENALYWLMEYRFDGLRFDAVHAIAEPDWLDEMAAEVRAHCRARPACPSRAGERRQRLPRICSATSMRSGTTMAITCCTCC